MNHSNRLRVLYLEDDDNDVALLRRRFGRDELDCDLFIAKGRDIFLQAVEEGGFDVILADYRVPGFTGLEALCKCQEKCPETPFLFLSGNIGEDLAVEALKTGAVDYVLKDRMDRLTPAIRRALREANERAEHRRTQECLHETEALNRAILAALPSSIALIDKQGTIVAVNEAWTRLARRSDSPLVRSGIGTDYFEICQKASETAVLTGIRAVVAGTTPVFTGEYGSKPPHQTWFLLQATSLSGPHGGAVVSHIDISERRRQEEALQQARDELEGRVRERTAALSDANAMLKKEILEREATEQALLTKTNSLTGLTSALEMQADLLAALTKAMSVFLESGDYTKANGYLLRCALKQTQSDYGFIGVVREGSALRILSHDGNLRDHLLNGSFNENDGCLEVKDFDNLLGQVVRTGKRIVSNKPGTGKLGLPAEYPPPRSFLGMPIYSGSDVVGVIGIVNREGGYTGHEQMIIETLVRQAGVLCVAYRRREAETAAENSRRTAEKFLWRSEERFQLAARATNDVLWDWNIVTGNVWLSDRLAVFGYGPEQIEPSFEWWLERVHPDDRQRISHSINSVINSNETSWSGQYRFRREDGSYAYILDRSYVVRDSDGRAVRMVGAMMDLSEHKRLETATRESEERFRLLLEGVEDYAIFMVDTQGRIVSWNTGAEKMTGFTEAEIIGRHYDCFHPRDAIENGNPDKHLQLAASQGRFREEGWRVRKDRSQFWADVVITPLRDPTGNLRGFAKVVHDATARKYAEEVLRGSEERTRLIVEGAHDAFIATDSSGVIITCNRQAEKMFGWNREEVVGRLFTDTITPATYSEENWGSLKRSIREHLPVNARFEMIAQRRDRHEFPVEMAITSIPLGQDYILSSFLRDITERRRSEELLKRLPGQLLGAQEAERRRVARELHDSVGQLLSSVKIRIQFLEQSRVLWCLPSTESSNGSPNGRGQNARETIRQARRVLEKCMTEVRRLARNLMPSELEDLGLVPALRNLCKEFQQRNGLAIELKCRAIPTWLPKELALPLFRIVQEALSNAAKHSQATRVTVSLSRKGPVLTAVIKDNGKGFDARQANCRKNRRSGMGLVNMKERASSIGGKLQIQSIAAKGTRIKIEFPIAVARTGA